MIIWWGKLFGVSELSVKAYRDENEEVSESLDDQMEDGIETNAYEGLFIFQFQSTYRGH